MSARPSLQEIAAMPFPASMNAMREFYNKDWGKPVPEGGKLRLFKVHVDYSYTVCETETLDIEAYCREEAEEKAEEEIEAHCDEDFEIDLIKILSEEAIEA